MQNKMKDLISRIEADKYQDFFNMMSEQHGLTLTIGEMDDIINEAKQVGNKSAVSSDVSTRLLFDNGLKYYKELKNERISTNT